MNFRNLRDQRGRLIPIFQALDSPRKTFAPDSVFPVALSLTINHTKIIRLYNHDHTGSVLARFPIPPSPSFLLNNATAEGTSGSSICHLRCWAPCASSMRQLGPST